MQGDKTRMIKICEVAYRRPGMGVEDFQAHWLGTHGPIVGRIPGIRRYVQCHVLLGAYRKAKPPAFDGIPMAWFDNIADMRLSGASDPYARTKADEVNFLEPGRIGTILPQEHVIVG